MDMNVSLVVPFFNHWDLTYNRLIEFRQYLPDNVEIVLVNDASTDNDVINGVAFWQKSGIARQKILYVKNKENLGFGGSHNAGAEASNNDIIVFYSNDVICRGDFVTPLLQVFDKEPKQALVGNRLIYWPAGWNEFVVNEKPVVIPYLEGYFIACTRSEFSELGGWDDKTFGKFDYEDVDLSTKALSLEYNLVAFNCPLLHHLGGKTIASLGVDRMKVTEQNREKFISKWTKFLSERV